MSFKFVSNKKNPIFGASKATTMKRILAFLLLVSFLSACSQYTCPTYSKKELKKTAPQNRI